MPMVVSFPDPETMSMVETGVYVAMVPTESFATMVPNFCALSQLGCQLL